MSLFVVGLNHHTAPIDMRERMAVAPHRLSEALRRLKGVPGIREAVVLSTCNRFEAYLHSPDASSTRAAMSGLFQPVLQQGVSDSHLYEFTAASAARHLFRVASGLDSMVVGEHEILGQVKQAYAAAQTAGTTGKLMNVLFQRGLFTGKRVRTETGISRGAGSVAGLAVTLADKIFHGLQDSCVMILGAGDMAERTARRLHAKKVRSFIVSNRTYERACVLAEQFGGTALRFDQWLDQMIHADIVVCSTAAPHPIVRPEHVRDLMKARHSRSLVFLDIAMPRDVHPEVRKIENVHVYNLDDLQAAVDQQLAERRKAISAAESIIDEQAQEFHWWLECYRQGSGYSLCHRNLASGEDTKTRARRLPSAPGPEVRGNLCTQKADFRMIS